MNSPSKSTRIRRVPKRRMIKDQVIRWIREQNLAPGDRISSQNDLAQVFGVTPLTVHRALTDLAREGVVYRRKGQGTFVGREPSAICKHRLCLVLPGAHRDQPEQNPDYWPYVQTLLRAFLEAAGDQWTMSTRIITEDTDPQSAVTELAHHDVVFFHHDRTPVKLVNDLIKRKIVPVVRLGQPRDDLQCMTIDHDRPKGATLAVTHLIERGYRRIGFIGSSEWWGELSYQGYVQALERFGLSPDESRVIRTGEPRREGYRAAAVLVSRKMPCDAIFVDSDMRALGVLDCLQQEGVNVPGDVAVIGYDGLDIATEQRPYLTTVKIPSAEMIAWVLRQLPVADRRLPRKHVPFVGQIVHGATVGQR